MRISTAYSIAASIGAAILVSPGQATVLTTQRVASGLTAPVFVTSPPGDLERVFIVDQPGRIRILKNGVLLNSPFLNIVNRVSYGGERGLLGMAFHPQYASNGYFYVNYTNTSGNTVVSRFTVSTNPDSAVSSSEMIILTVIQPFSNHNGGMIAFGPNDGYLYIGMGDGGSGGDPGNRAQSDNTLLGKMLRVDVDGGNPYAIPPDNPFVGPGDPLDEIWAKGLRNPWRFAFDRLTMDLFIADVGQNSWEEIDFQPAASPGGENYGWRLMEGNHCFNPPSDCDPGGLTYPIYEYSHGGSPFRCSITGGYVYRGGAIPDLQGTYFFGDYCSAQIWSFRYDGNDITEFLDRTAELDPAGPLTINDISSFGEDATGELYVTDLGGEVFKVVPVNPGRISGTVTNALSEPIAGAYVSVSGTAISDTTDAAGAYSVGNLGNGSFSVSFSHPDFEDTVITEVPVIEGEITVLNVILSFLPGPECDYVVGDASGDQIYSGADVMFGVNLFFLGGPDPDYMCECPPYGTWAVGGDANGDCVYSGGDIIYGVNMFFREGPEPIPCPACEPNRLRGSSAPLADN